MTKYPTAGRAEGLPTLALLTAFLAVSLLAGCVQPPQTDANTFPPVPALIDEVTPKPPVTVEALMWQPGHWDWNGSAYVWARGQYVPAAGHGNLWMPGWWTPGKSGWIWQPPHWMS